MKRDSVVYRALTCGVAFFVASASIAQTKPPLSDAQSALADYCAHKDDFGYLLGSWKFSGTRKTVPAGIPIQGVWSATMSADGPLVTDEFRMVDATGRTTYMSTTMRVLNVPEKRWRIVGIEPALGIPQLGTAWKEGSDLHIDQTFTQLNGAAARWRIRYYNITSDSFDWRADRSLDDGVTWTENFMRLTATRTGPAAPPRSNSELASTPQLPTCK